MESTGFENKKNSKSFVNDHAGLWAILACLFFVTTVIFASLYFTKSSDYKEVVALEEKSTQDNQDLVRQLDSLKAEHARIKLEIGRAHV